MEGFASRSLSLFAGHKAVTPTMCDRSNSSGRYASDQTNARGETKNETKNLGEAFGEGWETVSVGRSATPTWRPVVVSSRATRLVAGMDEAQWDATLEAVKQFERTHGRFPKRADGAAKGKLYDWLPLHFYMFIPHIS